MSPTILLSLVLVPAIAGVLCLGCVRSLAKLGGPLLVLATLANMIMAIVVFKQPLQPLVLPFGAPEWQMVMRFRLDNFSSFIVLAAAVLSFLLALYAAQFMSGKKSAAPFFAFYLFTVALLQGAVLADHLLTLLFFWEGMLLTLFGMIVLGHAGAYKTAVKAFFINGVTDLCLMAGIGLVWLLSHQMTISGLAARPLSVENWAGGLAFALMLVGAISKAGSMPFHSWIPDAAVDAPMPFMAFMPGAMEKLIGIYFTARISLDLFRGVGDSWAGMTMMIVGAVTILLAVLMALVQKDFKRLLSFHAISQVGYMILGIGTGTTIGIVGGLFHMVNNALYKSTLFLTGGAVEHRLGTTDLRKFSGLGKLMPITMGCFVIAALSISGFPLTNGFFSKELIYDAALERGWYFYAAAAVGSFFTAASFLKLGHAAFFGPFLAPKPQAEIKDPPWMMLVPMVVIAGLCLVFGYRSLPIDYLIVPAVSAHLHGLEHLYEVNWALVGGTALALTLAALNHWYGFKRTMSGLGAVDHIHYAPVAHQLYDAAGRRWFDPYELALKFINVVAQVGYLVDRLIDYVYNKVVTGIANAFSGFMHDTQTGSHAAYLVWSAAAAALIVIYFVGGF